MRPGVKLLPSPEARAAGVGSSLPLRAKALIAAAALCTMAAALGARGGVTNEDWTAVVLLALLGMAAERLDIDLYGESRVSVSVLFMVMTAVSLGASAVLLVCPAVAIAGHLFRGRPLYKLVFNTSVFTLAGLASAALYGHAMASLPYDGKPVELLAMMVAALANFIVSSVLVASIVAATTSTPVRAVWEEKFAWLIPHFALFGLLAFPLTLAYDAYGAYGVLGFVAPVVMSRLTLKQYVDRTERTVTELREKHAEVQRLIGDLEDAYNETIDAFVAALDTRDVETHGHSSRVSQLSLELGRALGIREGSDEWLDLKHGALLHDVGKIGVPDAILRKPDEPTEAEWKLIRTHPVHGYKMLRGVHFLARAAELVYAHHERWDGEGYPRGLKREEIPLGARIFAVADTFDAITSDRPYRSARSTREACDEIGRHSGTQFDPRVVDVLLKLKGHETVRAA